MAVTPSNRILPIASHAPEFELPDAHGQTHTLDDVRGPRGLLVMFVCNHCPFVVHLASALSAFAKELEGQGIGVVAINSNDIERYPADAPDKSGNGSGGFSAEQDRWRVKAGRRPAAQRRMKP